MRKEIGKMIILLYKKGVRIFDSKVENVSIVDISKAKDLGNRSWGYIDFFTKQGYSMIGIVDYNKSNTPIVKEVNYHKRKIIPLVEKEKQKKWHSYADLANVLDSSESRQLQEINHFQNKFNRHVFNKNKADKIRIKALKRKLDIPFGNVRVYNSEYGTKVPVN